MITIFFLIFAFLSLIYIISPQNDEIKIFLLILVALILIIVAGFRGKGVDNDYYVYRTFWMINNLKGSVEYSYYLIKYFVKNELGLGFQYLLLTYAILGVLAKVTGILKSSPVVWGSLLIYFCHYFILHEFTQIRVGVATGFVLLSISKLSEKKYIGWGIFTAIAIFFHQSCFVAIVFILISNNKKTSWIFSLLIPLGYVLYFFNTYLNINIPIPGLQDKVELYEQATESGFLKDSKVNAFNILYLIKILIFYVLYIYRERIAIFFPQIYIYHKIYAISLFCFLFLSKIPVFAFRIQELIGVVEIILIPTIIFIFSDKFRWIGKLSVISIALMLLLLDIFYVKLIILK